MIELTQIDAWKGIRETADGVEIGAVTTLTEIAKNPIIRERYGVLAQAAGVVASPQIRNVGTLGGNLNQDARCWYTAGPGLLSGRRQYLLCRLPGRPESRARHLWREPPVAVSPSDTAPTLVALDATMVIASQNGTRTMSAQDFFIGPDRDIRSMTALDDGEILTAVRLPAAWANADFYFEKVADRNVWDFALTSVAAVMKVSGGTIEDARIACGAVECVPRRLEAVENAIRGQQRSDELGAQQVSWQLRAHVR